MDYNIQNDNLRAYIDEDIDHESVTRLRPVIEELIEKHKPVTLIFDFTNVDFMDSAGIGFIIGRYKTMKKFGGKMKITNAKSSLIKIMHMACIERLVEIN